MQRFTNFKNSQMLLSWIMIVAFPKSIILYFHTAIFLGIELKMNVYETYVRSMYALFPWGYEGAAKLVLL